jgi:hypothetical protein
MGDHFTKRSELAGSLKYLVRDASSIQELGKHQSSKTTTHNQDMGLALCGGGHGRTTGGGLSFVECGCFGHGLRGGERERRRGEEDVEMRK